MGSEGDGGSVGRSKGVRTRWVLSPLAGLRRLSHVERALRRRVDSPTAPLLDEQPPRIEVLPDAFDRVGIDGAVDQPPASGATLGEVARRTAAATLVVLGLVALALALWKIRLVVGLLFLAFTIAAAMRPGVDALHRHGVPRSIGILLHYALLAGLVALFLWLVVPSAIEQVQAALGGDALGEAAGSSTGVRHEILAALDQQLQNLPSASELVPPVLEYGRKAFEIFIGIFFTFASAAFWIYERDRAVDLISSLVARPRRKKLRDTWELVDLKLGAFVRGQLLLIILIGVILSLAFMVIGVPYWLLVGSFAGIVEIVPVIGPLVAGAVAVGVGFTASLQVAVLAGLAVLAVRLLEDYIVIPKLLGHSVGLSPLVVLASVATVGILFGGFAVIIAIPIASLVATLVDVIVRGKNPAEENVPAVMFTAKDADAE